MVFFEILRNELIEKDFKFETPYGDRLLTYADFTASARGLNFIEKYLLELQKSYANTHTEDDMTTFIHIYIYIGSTCSKKLLIFSGILSRKEFCL